MIKALEIRVKADSRCLLENIKQNAAVMDLFNKYRKKFAPESKEMTERIGEAFKRREKAGKQVKFISVEEHYLELPHVLSDTFRQEAFQAIHKGRPMYKEILPPSEEGPSWKDIHSRHARMHPVHQDILTSKILRDFDFSFRESIDNARSQFHALATAADRLLDPQSIVPSSNNP